MALLPGRNNKNDILWRKTQCYLKLKIHLNHVKNTWLCIIIVIEKCNPAIIFMFSFTLSFRGFKVAYLNAHKIQQNNWGGMWNMGKKRVE